MANIPLLKFLNNAPPLCISNNVYVKDASCLLKPSGCRWLVLVKRTYTFTDTDDAAEWATAITAGNVIVIPTSGKLNPPEIQTTEGKGALRTQNIATKQSFDVKADFPDENMDLMNRLNYNGRDFGAIFVHNDGEGAETTAYAAMQDDAQSFAFINFMAAYSHEVVERREMSIKGEWFTKFMPQVMKVPTSILITA